MGLSLVTCDLGAVFELIGATSACALAYILPPLCYLKLASKSWRTIPAVLCICFGCGVLGVSLVMAVGKMIKSKFLFPFLSFPVELNGGWDIREMIADLQSFILSR